MNISIAQSNAPVVGVINQSSIKIERNSNTNSTGDGASFQCLRTPPENADLNKRQGNVLLTSLRAVGKRKEQHIYAALFMIWIVMQITVWKEYCRTKIDIIQPIENYVVTFDEKRPDLSSNATTNRTRKVGLLQYSTMQSDSNQMDSYSGMWWVRRDVFVSKWNTKASCQNYEGASYKLFNELTNANIYMTKDWLDFSVEHLSHYFKLIDIESLPTFESMLNKYLQSPKKRYLNFRESAFHDTLAILPVYFSDSNTTCNWSILLQDVPGDKGKLRCLYMYSLSATLKSLWQAGVRRVILAGNFVDEPAIIQQAIGIFWSYGPGQNGSNMDVHYVFVANEGQNNGIPCNALDQLLAALSNYMPSYERSHWLGDGQSTQDGWKYIYFSEPDMLLHSRSFSLSAITDALNDGKLLTAHRFQLMKHEIDAPPNLYNPYSTYLPNYQHFSNFTDLDVEAGDSCCDAGNWWPGIDDFPHCGNWWYLCGFNADERRNRKQAYPHHERLFSYPNIRLTNGMNVPVVQAHGRVCSPKKDGGGCD